MNFRVFFSSKTAKSSQEISRLSSINNQTNTGYENQTEQHSPWYWYNYNQPYGSVAPQSPHCHYNHHLGGSEQHYCRPMCMPQIAPGMSNDPMLMQQFIQTQQMLINSMSQCNQLLWDQQREINNLNSAVLLVTNFYWRLILKKIFAEKIPIFRSKSVY